MREAQGRASPVGEISLQRQTNALGACAPAVMEEVNLITMGTSQSKDQPAEIVGAVISS